MPGRRNATQNFKKQIENNLAARDKNIGGAKISYNDTMLAMKKEKLDALQKNANEIKQEARKELILNQITHPKVSQIQNFNQDYIVRKLNQKIIQDQ